MSGTYNSGEEQYGQEALSYKINTSLLLERKFSKCLASNAVNDSPNVPNFGPPGQSGDLWASVSDFGNMCEKRLFRGRFVQITTFRFIDDLLYL